MATNPERSTEEKVVDDAIEQEPNDKNSTKEEVVDDAIEQEPNDKNSTIDGDITADAADRYAESIRPSWVYTDSTQSVQKEASELEQPSNSNDSPNVASIDSQSGSSREDTDAELKLAAATILPVKKVRTKTLLWAGGITAGLLLIALSVVTQKEQKTSLWESKKVEKPNHQQRPPNKESAEATSGAKLASKPSIKSTVEPSATIAASPTNRIEETRSERETNDSIASSQAAEQPTSKPIDGELKQKTAEPPKVRIQVRTVPPTAELTLDGSSVPNPFDQLLPKNGEHVFVARAHGYSKRYRRIAFDRDRELSLRLARKKTKIRSTRSRATKTVSRRKRVKSAPVHPSTTRRTTSSARTSRKGFISENPY